jgi:hypothetical protein
VSARRGGPQPSSTCWSAVARVDAPATAANVDALRLATMPPNSEALPHACWRPKAVELEVGRASSRLRPRNQGNGRILDDTDPRVIQLSEVLRQMTLHPQEDRLPQFRNPNGVAQKTRNLVQNLSAGAGE